VTYPLSELEVVSEPAAVRVSASRQMVHLCPHKDEVDEGTATIAWTCVGATIELHSLARYLDAFEEASISHESLTETLRRDLSSLEGISEVEVATHWKTAGSHITVTTA
jgi:NADPH-dependent 7-cyano-7-deazaguanine reductase QueF